MLMLMSIHSCAPGPQINRLLLVGRDSVHQVAERFLSQRQKIIDEEAAAQQRGGHPPFRSDD